MSEGERRLEAVMFTDVVGYTALTQENENRAITLLERHNELLRPVFIRHHGREIKAIGDAFLVEFDSALAATECAIDIQDSLKEYNRYEGSGTRPLMVRIGIHIGDVVHRGGDIFGDAVNIASRVEPLADPGGICISEQVYVQVRNKIPYSVVKLPNQALKNVSFPMDIYKVVLPSRAERTQGQEAGGAPSSSKRRVAILPFGNISPDPSDEYFAEGMTEELTAAISQVHELRVIARTSTARYKGTSKSVSEIGKELGVGSILEGSVRKAANKVRVTAQLVDSASEEHVWSDSYERQLDDVFSIQRDIATRVAEALKVSLLSDEKERISRKMTENGAAYVRYLKGRAALHGREQRHLNEAKRLFEEAVSEDPNYAKAYVGLADTYFLLGEYHYMQRDRATAEAKQALTTALSLDEDLPEGRTSLANLLQHEYKFAEAELEYQRAIALNASYAQAHHWYSVCLWDMGRTDAALRETKLSGELDPLSVVIAFNVAVGVSLQEGPEALAEVQKIRELDPQSHFADMAMSFIRANREDFEGAAAYQELVVKKRPEDMQALSRLGFLYGRIGKTEEARDILKRLEQVSQGPVSRTFEVALVHAGLGETDKMFELFEKAFDDRTLTYRAIVYEHFLPGVRQDPRYSSFFTRVGLPVPTTVRNNS